MADTDGRYSAEKVKAALKAQGKTATVGTVAKPGSPALNDLYCGPASAYAVQQWNGSSWVAFSLAGYTRDN